MGNTLSMSWMMQPLAVHPHACGEHVIGMDAKYPDAGSSPRLWGTRFIAAAHIISLRFIPTPVGNTHQLHIQLIAPPVHPHACGEHEDQMKTVKSLIGSSPRLWGTRRPDEDSEKPDRFIPTPVGNTQPLRGSLTALMVHPHACGEHAPHNQHKSHISGSSPRLWGTLPWPFAMRYNSGSSPRLWGTQFPHLLHPRPQRFIPTPVGNTFEPVC